MKKLQGIKFCAVDGAHIKKKDAPIIGSAIRKIELARGKCAPKDLVAAARPTSSPLHHFFEWNDGKAAEKYRLEQARYLIRSVMVQVVEVGGLNLPPTRAFVSIVDSKGDHAYSSTVETMSTTAGRALIVQRAYRELASWRVRYERFDELADAVASVDAVLKAYKKL